MWVEWVARAAWIEHVPKKSLRTSRGSRRTLAPCGHRVLGTAMNVSRDCLHTCIVRHITIAGHGINKKRRKGNRTTDTRLARQLAGGGTRIAKHTFQCFVVSGARRAGAPQCRAVAHSRLTREADHGRHAPYNLSRMSCSSVVGNWAQVSAPKRNILRCWSPC